MSVVGRSLHGMSTRLHRQHRSNTNNSSLLLSQLYHHGISNTTSSSRRLHFQHYHNSFSPSRSTSAVVSFTDKKSLALSVFSSCRRDLHCQHSLGKPPQIVSFTFHPRFPAYHQQQNNISHRHRNSCSCYCLNDKHINKRQLASFSSSPQFRNYSAIAAMSSLHLATGSVCPPLQEGKIRIYNMKYCPFAQRALLVAEAKGIPYEIVNCNLKDKPEWLLEKNPEGKVPVLETNDGKILYESLIVADYLDEVYPSQRPLHPKDAHKKALDRIMLEKFSSVYALFYKILFAVRENESDSVKQERIANFVQSLKPFEDELSRRGTVFFGGNDKPAMLDLMIWPWFERIPAVKSKLPDLFDYDAAKTQNPNLEKWRQAMKKDPAVSNLLLPPDLHLKFMETFLAGSPNYDL